MKKYIPIIKPSALIIWALTMLTGCSSLYISKSYSGNKCHEFLDKYLQNQGWERTIASENLIEFKKGPMLAFTFNYDDDEIEVQIHVTKKSFEYFDVSVGNYGLTYEVNQMKNRFERISEKIDEKIQENCL